MLTRARTVAVNVLRIVLLVTVAWALLGFLLQRHLLFPGRGLGVPGDPPAGVERLWLETPVGRVEAWYRAAPGASSERQAPAVVVAHGNAERIDQVALSFRPYLDLGVSVLLVEYPGYGRSEGAPTETSVTDTMVAALRELLSRPEVDAERVIYHGRSLGAGAVCRLLDQHEPAALVLQSPFTSVRAFAREFLLPGFLVRDPFDNEAALASYDGPLLLLHGEDDRVVPPEHSEQLLTVAPQATRITYACGHNDFPPDPARYWADLERFLRDAGVLD